MNGDATAVFSSIKDGTGAVGKLIQGGKLTSNLPQLAKEMNKLAFAIPIISITMDLTVGTKTESQHTKTDRQLTKISG